MAIVHKMKENSVAHHSADKAEQNRLDNENISLGKQLQGLIGRVVIRGGDGVWYLDRVGGSKLYETYPYSTYHTGGFVGDTTLKQDEVFSKLKKNELVLTEEQQKPIFSVLNFAETMLGRYGELFNAVSNGDLLSSRINDQIKQNAQSIQNEVNDNYSLTIAPHVQIQISDNIKNTSDARRLGRIAGESAISTITDAFAKKGKIPIGKSLKP